MQTTRLYIDGAFVAPHAGGSFEAINPATETAFARIAAGVTERLAEITRYDHTRSWGWYL